MLLVSENVRHILIRHIACCRCNCTGRCQNCFCVKSGRASLPQRLRNCVNTVQTQPSQADLIGTPAPLSHQNSFLSPLRSLNAAPNAAPPPSPPTQFHIEFHSPPEFLTSSSPLTRVPETSSLWAPCFPSICWTQFYLGQPDGPWIHHTTYDEVVHWRRILYPLEKLEESLLMSYTGSIWLMVQHQPWNLWPDIVLLILLLQKPTMRSKIKEHTKCLESRLRSWSNGNLEELVKEGRVL